MATQQATTTTSAAHVAQAAQAQMERNFESLLRIPWEQCPWPEVRTRMLSLALAGADIYAYRPAHQHEYVIWHRQADPAVDARFTPRAWAIRYGYDVSEPTADGKEGA